MKNTLKACEKILMGFFKKKNNDLVATKHFGIEPNAVKYYLKKHNLYQNLR